MPQNTKKTSAKKRSFVQKPISRKWINLPLAIPIFLAGAAAFSYAIASWFMRPIGDDYGWLAIFYHNPHWAHDTWRYILTANGRYSQNLLSIAPYSLFGPAFLKVAGILVVLLFTYALYIFALSVVSRLKLRIDKQSCLCVAFLFFLGYTAISVTLPSSRGGIDNTFQDLLGYSDALTYTVPYSLLLLLVSWIFSKKQPEFTKLTYLVILLSALFIGMFDEVITLAFFLIAAICLIFYGAAYRQRLGKLCRQYWPGFLVLAIGLICGFLIVHFSPAARAREGVVLKIAGYKHVSVIEALQGSATGASHYFTSYVIGSGAKDYYGLIAAFAIGVFISLPLLKKLRKPSGKLFGFLGVSILASLFLYIVLLLACSFSYIYGYQLPSSLAADSIPPRFEIIFNVWLAAALLMSGILAGSFLNFIAIKPRAYRFLVPTYASLLFVASLVLAAPLMAQISERLQVVANFSSSWNRQNQQLEQAARKHRKVVRISVVDIGGAYVIDCHADIQANDWLGEGIETYYHIPKVCSKD